jgi:outer membrane biosynthesis protein TonB
MKTGTRMALGVAAGYLLGRTKKGRLALMIAAAGATGKTGVSPTSLVQSGLKQLSSSAEVGQLTSLARDELLSAVKSAAVTAASGRIESLSERLQDGGGLTRGKKSKAEDEPAEDQNGEDEAQEESQDEAQEESEDEAEAEAVDEDEEEAEEEPEPEKPKRRRAAARRSSADDSDTDSSGERPRQRRSSGRRAAASDDGQGSGGARTTTKRSPVRRTRR